MLVSQFELVFEKQSPAGPADTVLQGYFLEVSNLEAKDLFFNLKFTTASINDANRSLFDNAVVFVDTPGNDNQQGQFALFGGAQSKSFSLTRRFRVPAHGTALVAVLPSDPFTNARQLEQETFETRGYVELTLPTISENRILGKKVPQSKTPVRVLLTAQNRATYFKEDGAISSQTQSSLPLANGAALNEVPPEKVEGLSAIDVDDLIGLIDRDDLDFEKAIGMFALIAEEGDFSKINAALRDLGVGMAVERRTVKEPEMA